VHNKAVADDNSPLSPDNTVTPGERAYDDGLTDAQRAYLTGRLSQYQSWYDRKAIRTKTRFLRMRTCTVVGGAVVPVLVNLSWPYLRIATTVISLVVVVLVSLESVYHYREQWKNYRSTEQLLGHEAVYFENRIGPYGGLDREEAFRRLVDRVESAIASENAATLNTMTLAAEATHKEGVSRS
jgi:Protein of unknown function (DUF4231)